MEKQIESNVMIKNRWLDTLYTAGVIATKDITEALKNPRLLVNIILALGLVVFFHFMLTLRPFDKEIEVLVVGTNSPDRLTDTHELGDGYTVTLNSVDSQEQMARNLGYRDLGLVIPPDFERTLAGGGQATLPGYINWSQRSKVSELEAQYSRQFSELLGQPVSIAIGENIIKPSYDTTGAEDAASFHLLLAILYMASVIVPYLVLEERLTRTIEALFVSPASSAQVVLGKALAGLFFVALSGVLAFILNRVYVIDWGMAILVAVLSAIFSTLLALAVGTFLKSPQQMSLWTLVLMLGLLVPGWFAHEPNLSSGFKTLISFIPTSSLALLFGYACSVGTPLSLILKNFAIALGYTALVYGVVIWQVRRADR